MPLPNHCIECDKPITEGIVCGYCQDKLDGRICIRCNSLEDGCKCGDNDE
jgi:hypothetical protein